MLLIAYLREKGEPRIDFGINHVALFSILSDKCKDDLKVIIDDYRIINEKIASGRAHELSEGDTRYLGACTKGASAKKSLQPQFYNDEVPAKRRAFSLKQGYMTHILNEYILNNVETYEPAISSVELDLADFDTIILNRINRYIGQSEMDLYKRFEVDPKNKQKNNQVVCRMLGVRSDNVAEFEKADIVIKTIRVKKNGVPKESMSFPRLTIKEFVNETFEDSQIYDYFAEKRFLFVVFRENEDRKFYLSGARFWNMPINELETVGKEEWEWYRQKFIDGVNFTPIKRKNGVVVANDLKGKTETKMFHLRPHAAKSAHIIGGIKYGNGSDQDMDELPNGDKMTKQSFWLNNGYIKEIIKDI